MMMVAASVIRNEKHVIGLDHINYPHIRYGYEIKYAIQFRLQYDKSSLLVNLYINYCIEISLL